MLELTIDRLPGGDAARRQTLVRITLTNTGEGVGDVKVYRVQVVHGDDLSRRDLKMAECRTHRGLDESVLQLAHRALGKLLNDRG